MRYSSPASGKSPVKVTVVTPVGAATAEGVFEKNAPVMRCSYQGSGKSPVKVTEVTAVGATTAGGAFEKSPCDEMLVPRRGESLGSDGAWSRHRRVSRARARARQRSISPPIKTEPVSLGYVARFSINIYQQHHQDGYWSIRDVTPSITNSE